MLQWRKVSDGILLFLAFVSNALQKVYFDEYYHCSSSDASTSGIAQMPREVIGD